MRDAKINELTQQNQMLMRKGSSDSGEEDAEDHVGAPRERPRDGGAPAAVGPGGGHVVVVGQGPMQSPTREIWVSSACN